MENILDEQLKTQLLDEARRIGDQLLADAETDEHGMSWETMGMDDDHNTIFSKSEGIYSGVSGISLFLLELSRVTGDQRYFDAAKSGILWVVHRCNTVQSDYYALFTGRMGVCKTLLRFYHVTGEKAFLDDALTVAAGSKDALASAMRVNDILNGGAGTLTGLLHLHAASGEEWLLETAEKYADILVNQAFAGPKGLYWDRGPQTVCGLCGYSHGAAGIGLTFLECGNYLKNPAFFRLAELAFLYEDHHYIEERKNWPDLRNGIYTDDDREKHQEAYEKNDMAFFTSGGDMNAWCHGAAGIGHSRLRAFQLLKNDLYDRHLDICLEKTIKTDVEAPATKIKPTFTLCHGNGGNADIFLEAYRLRGDEKYLNMAAQVAQSGLKSHKEIKMYLPGYRLEGKKEDRSMFMGNAGVGYFYLRVLDPHGIPTMLNAYLDAQIDDDHEKSLKNYPVLSITPQDLFKRLLEKDFSRTIGAADLLDAGIMETFFKNNPLTAESHDHLTAGLLGFLENTISQLPQPQKERMEDVFTLEKEKQALDRKIESHSYMAIKSQVLAERAEALVALGDEELIGLTLALDKDILVSTTRWHWPLNQPEKWKESLDPNVEEDDWPVLLKATATNVLEVELSPFSYTILAELYPENTVEKCIRGTVEAFDSLTPEEEKMLNEKILQQVRQFLQAGILLEKKK